MNSTIPDFEVAASGNQRFSSVAFRGHPYIVYFYPKDDTPGCTLESIQFRDLHSEFRIAGVMVFGVSRDSVASHDRFQAKLNLPFDLLSDKDEVMCKLFDVIKEKNMYGKNVFGIERSTFVMGRKGELLHEWRGVKVNGHAAEVLAVVRGLC